MTTNILFYSVTVPGSGAGFNPPDNLQVKMRILDLDETADFLIGATIEETADYGHTIVHRGTSATGRRFVMMNDCLGKTVVSLFG